MEQKFKLSKLLLQHEMGILEDWSGEQIRQIGMKISVEELKNQCQRFIRLFTEALQASDFHSIHDSVWEPLRSLLTEVSKKRTQLGFSPTETALFVLSLRKTLFKFIKQEIGDQSREFVEEIEWISSVMDQLGLFTFEVYQKTRNEIILRQQEEMLELSTPVVELWDGILALPMIGTLDSSRTQVVMESLLQKIMDTGSEIAIVDITGVPTVDTLVAQHLIKTVTAARLMGAECILSGIRPQIAATIVHLGVDLGNIITKASLADAFGLALSKTGKYVESKARVGSAQKLNARI